jgi:hypothetical protein
MSLSISRNFPGIFVIFRVFLVPLKQFLLFLELFLALKIISKKNLSFSTWVEPVGSTRSYPRPRRPGRQARQGPSAEAGHGRHGQEPRPPPAFSRRPCRARQAARALKTASPGRPRALAASAAPMPLRAASRATSRCRAERRPSPTLTPIDSPQRSTFR